MKIIIISIAITLIAIFIILPIFLWLIYSENLTWKKLKRIYHILFK